MGDKKGALFLLDASWKIILDKVQVNATDAWRVTNIESKSIQWADTHLFYISVVSRAVPDIKIYLMKSNENKLFHHFTIKGIVPDADANPTPDTCYLDYPWEVKMSEDCVFICVTTYRGVVHVLRLPDPPIPFFEEKQDEKQTSIWSGDELKLNFDTDISKS